MVAKPLDFNNENVSCEQNYNCYANLNECNGNLKHCPLPIDHFKKHIMEILGYLEETVIFIGETASGKSTRIPQFCHEIGHSDNGLIAVTQPRRVAAKTLAERVASEMGTDVGKLVGYKFRFDFNSCNDTCILYLTEGILLRESQYDVRLSKYSTIIVDEVHERTINMDILLYTLKQAQMIRRENNDPSLRIILMSATMDLQKLQEYFDKAEVYYVRGRQHIVKLFNAPSLSINENDYLFNAISAVLQLHLSEPTDHGFLVFLTGQEEIETAIHIIKKTKKNEKSNKIKQYENIFPLPFYASIPSWKQTSNIFSIAPKGTRKVVFSTNIAETSITIPGICLVIDSGKIKRRIFSPQNHMDVLEVVNISKAQAVQRAGRAGREAPGKCYRLYSQQDLDEFESVPIPEILRSNISSALLCLIHIGLTHLGQIDKLIDRPSHEQLQSAIEELLALNAIELEQLENNLTNLTVNITDEGRRILEFPIEPVLAKILLAASTLNCLDEACTVVAFLSVENVFQNTNQDIFCRLDNGKYGQEDSSLVENSFNTNEGDHIRYVKIFRKYNSDKNIKKDKNFFIQNGILESSVENVIKIRKQLIKICQNKLRLDIRSSICKGLFQNVCIYDHSINNYVLLKDRKVVVRIHPSSCLKNQKMQAFVFSELIKTNEVYARDICPIQLDWTKEFTNMPTLKFNKKNISDKNLKKNKT